MIHHLNQYFDKIYCINLLTRKDRREKIQRRFDYFGIEVEFFDAVEYKFMHQFLRKFQAHGHDLVYPNELSCALGHYSIIKLAKDAGLKNVFIVEDDTVFLKTFNTDVLWYLENLPKDYDLFYLYLMMFKWPNFDYKIIEKDDKFLYKPHEAHCTSAYGINAKMFDPIIEYMDSNFRIIDSYYRIIQPNPIYNIYSCYPNLTSQDYDTSNIRGNGRSTIKLNYFADVVSFGDKVFTDYI